MMIILSIYNKRNSYIFYDSRHWDGKNNFNLSPSRTVTRSSYITNVMAANDPRRKKNTATLARLNGSYPMLKCNVFKWSLFWSGACLLCSMPCWSLAVFKNRNFKHMHHALYVYIYIYICDTYGYVCEYACVIAHVSICISFNLMV